jgi:hypothetical protein
MAKLILARGSVKFKRLLPPLPVGEGFPPRVTIHKWDRWEPGRGGA